MGPNLKVLNIENQPVKTQNSDTNLQSCYSHNTKTNKPPQKSKDKKKNKNQGEREREKLPQGLKHQNAAF